MLIPDIRWSFTWPLVLWFLNAAVDSSFRATSWNPRIFDHPWVESLNVTWTSYFEHLSFSNNESMFVFTSVNSQWNISWWCLLQLSSRGDSNKHTQRISSLKMFAKYTYISISTLCNSMFSVNFGFGLYGVVSMMVSPFTWTFIHPPMHAMLSQRHYPKACERQ